MLLRDVADDLVQRPFSNDRSSALRRKQAIVHDFCDMLQRLGEVMATRPPPPALPWLQYVPGLGLSGMHGWGAQSTPHRFTTKAQNPLVMDFLPVLYRGPIGSGVEDWMTDARWLEQYQLQRPRRDRGGSHAQFHRAEQGAVTLPHEDYDNSGDALATVIGLLKGEQVVVAWDEEVDGGILEELSALPRETWDARLNLLAVEGRLAIVLMREGSVLCMRSRVAHMIVTTQDKTQYSFHLYEDE